MSRQFRQIRRRDFLKSATTLGGFVVVPNHVLGGPDQTPPSERLNCAAIGAGSKGAANIHALSSENMVALCDVDWNCAARVFKQFPKAKLYRDYRQMLDKQKDIDAVVISTPDHHHAAATVVALELGKHVYCEKPLTHTLHEVKYVVEAARKAKVATQMGNQGHAGEGLRRTCEFIWGGVIGDVKKVEVWTTARGWAPKRPVETMPVPNDMDWDLWVGPAPWRPFHKYYHPFNWRNWWDFGCGPLGDMASHLMDVPYRALMLGYPTSVSSENTGVTPEGAPRATTISYQFPPREGMPAVEIVWHDGGRMPERPAGLDPRRKMGGAYGGMLFHGEKYVLMCGCYGERPTILPEGTMEQLKDSLPPKTLPRTEGIYKDFIQACKTGNAACSNFDIAGPLTEIIHLGNIATRCGEEISYDPETMSIPNVPRANEFIHQEYRDGWTL